MSNSTEFAYYEGSSSGSYLIVDVTEVKMSGNEIFSDILIVEYQGKEYEFKWDKYDATYKGEINGKRLEIL